MDIIHEFRGEHSFLSNFSPAKITIGGWTFPTSEHAFQAAKSEDPADWKDVQECVSPGAAKRMGRSIMMRPDWDNVKIAAMTEILTEKFKIPALREKLLATGDALLIEGNYWGDTYWGVCNKIGKNHLGRILMSVRMNIRIQLEMEKLGIKIP